jgi:hypothetical protein
VIRACFSAGSRCALVAAVLLSARAVRLRFERRVLTTRFARGGTTHSRVFHAALQSASSIRAQPRGDSTDSSTVGDSNRRLSLARDRDPAGFRAEFDAVAPVERRHSNAAVDRAGSARKTGKRPGQCVCCNRGRTCHVSVPHGRSTALPGAHGNTCCPEIVERYRAVPARPSIRQREG